MVQHSPGKNNNNLRCLVAISSAGLHACVLQVSLSPDPLGIHYKGLNFNDSACLDGYTFKGRNLAFSRELVSVNY